MLRNRYSLQDLQRLKDLYLADLAQMQSWLTQAESVNPRDFSNVGKKLEMLQNIALCTGEVISFTPFAALIDEYNVIQSDLKLLEKTLQYPGQATIDACCESFVTAAQWGRLKDLKVLMGNLQFSGCPLVLLNATLLEARRLTLITDIEMNRYLDECLSVQVEDVALEVFADKKREVVKFSPDAPVPVDVVNSADGAVCRQGLDRSFFLKL